MIYILQLFVFSLTLCSRMVAYQADENTMHHSLKLGNMAQPQALKDVAHQIPDQEIDIYDSETRNFSERIGGQSYYSHPEDEYYYPRFSQEFGVAAFTPSSKKIKKIYGKRWHRYQFRSTISIGPQDSSWRRIFFLCGFDYLKRKGASTLTQTVVKMKVVPIVFGARYLFAAKRWLSFSIDTALYFPTISIRNFEGTALADANNNNNQNNSQLAETCIKRSTTGLLFQGNISIVPESMFSLNLFANYTYAKMGERYSRCENIRNEGKLNISGFNVGASLGIHF